MWRSAETARQRRCVSRHDLRLISIVSRNGLTPAKTMLTKTDVFRNDLAMFNSKTLVLDLAINPAYIAIGPMVLY